MNKSLFFNRLKKRGSDEQTMKGSLSFRLVLWIGGTVMIVLVTSSVFILGQVFALERHTAQRYLEQTAKSHASEIKTDMEGAMISGRLVARALAAFSDLPGDTRRHLADNFLQEILRVNPGYYGLWVCYEPDLFDGLDAKYRSTPGSDATGRFIPYWYRKYGTAGGTQASLGTGTETTIEEITIHRTILTDYATPDKGDYYLFTKNSGKERIREPFVSRADESGILLMSIVTPIKNRYGRVLGAVGIDIRLDTFSQKLVNVKLYRTGYLELVSTTGTIAASPNIANIGKYSVTISGDKGQAYLESLASGEPIVITERSLGVKGFLTHAMIPIFVGNAPDPWIIDAMVPEWETLELSLFLILRVIAVFIVGAVVIIALVTILARSLVKPIKSASAALEGIAEGEGDLTMRIDVSGNDEIGKLAGDFNKFITKLEEIISNIRAAMDRLGKVGQGLSANMQETSSAVYEINANIESVKQQVTNQSAGVTETSSTIKEIAASIDRLGDTIAGQGENIAESSASVEEMVANIESVTKTLEKNGSQFSSLKESSDKGYSRITDVINRMQVIETQSKGLSEANAIIRNIASQTNLLAMNAAIEAAHAGDSGKGFAVVADEIRKLAEDASKQSKSISKDLRELKKAIDQVALSSTEAGSAFNSVRESISTVIEQQNQIRYAMEEQSTGNARVLESLARMRDQSGTVTASAQEIAGGSRAILDEMNELVEITQRIKESMDEMGSGTQEINKAITDVVSLSHENSEGIGSVSAEISRFTVSKKT